MQLAEWLTACRTFIQRGNYDTYGTYLETVAAFCWEWENHYQQHKRQYESEKFKKALHYAQIQEHFKCYFDFFDGKEPIDVAYSMLQQSVFVEKLKPLFEELEQTSSDSYKQIQAIFEDKERYKERLHEVISQQVFNDTKIRVRAFTDNGKWIKAASFKEFLDKCEKQNYLIETDKKRTVKRSYAAAIEQYDITTSVYQDYINDSTKEQEFDKKLFVNLAFALGLNATTAETLFKWNGYSIYDSIREFDAICRKAFKIGFGREYMIALIDKYNMELAARYKTFKPMHNITKNKRS